MNKYIKIISLLLIVAILFTPSTIFAFNKKEEIYVNLDSKGTPIKNIVNNTLTDIGIKNETDYSNLKNIKNLTGDEKLNIDGNKISFKGNNSLTYSGTSLKKLPIKVSIDYYLNNKKIDLNNLKNKKGKVTIDISFENLMYDKNTNLHTPFVVTTSILLNGVNKNIKVTNGKNINIANKNIILGISAPGLYEDLDNEALKDLDTVSISYDTDSFEENDIYFISSPKLLNKTDIEGIKNLDNVKSSFNKLSNGMNTLEDGSKKLNKGTNDLNKGTKSLSKGLKKALKGSNALKDGSNSLDDNLEKIIKGIETNKNKLDDKTNKLNEKLKGISKLKENNNNTILKLKTSNETIRSNVEEQGLDIEKETFYDDIANNIISEDSYKLLKTLKETYNGNIGLIELITINNESIDTMVNNLLTSSTEINTTIEELDIYLNKLKNEGTSVLKEGQENLTNGLEELYKGSKKLKKGTKSINKGTNSLSEGISKINNEGISKINDLVNIFDNYKDKVKDLIKLSKDYKGYASNNSNEVIFIFKVESEER